MLTAEMLTTANYMVILAGDRLYRPFDEQYRIEMPPEDLRLVYSRLTGNEWASVILALNNVQGLETFVRTQARSGRIRLDRRGLRLVRADLRSLTDAMETLKRVADARELDVPVVFIP